MAEPGRHPGVQLCSAVAVDSPTGDLIATAAHCVAGVTLGVGGSLSVAYVPAYQKGRAPTAPGTRHGSPWPPSGPRTRTRTTTSPSSNVTRPHPACRLSRSPAPNTSAAPCEVGTLGVLLGYPYHTDRPVGCRAAIARESSTQLRFDCGNFPTGTSGGPLLTAVDPNTGIGTLAGVIGGYQLRRRSRRHLLRRRPPPPASRPLPTSDNPGRLPTALQRPALARWTASWVRLVTPPRSGLSSGASSPCARR